jgi:5-methylcytosine-specific restriction protein B
MQAVASLIRARSEDEFNAARDAAAEELASIFAPAGWGLKLDLALYTEANLANIWQNELRASVRVLLEDEGKARHDYGEWLGAVHYVRVAAYRKALFETYKDNQGWRVLLLSLPAANAAGVGLASHYQGGQAHNKLAEVSNVLYDVANAGLSDGGGTSLPGRKVRADDWDRAGLIPEPILDVCGVDISSVGDGDGLWLKDVRTTTVKKVIASWISVEPLLPAAEDGDLEQALQRLEEIGRQLA